ncbi:hypothetical protein [Streptomyces sp. NPDC048636]|uniref:hypothetical protein n=1 Tax=Streptomyces sp. NPDC048636 TaxID=3155762 RepID=UPI00342B6CDA
MTARARRGRIAVAAVAGVAGVFCTAGTAPAAVAETSHAAGRHCLANTDNGQLRCFATFAEVMEHATAGRAAAAPDPATAARSAAFRTKVNADEEDLPAPATNRVVQPSDVVIGTFFTQKRYGGASLTLWGSHPCHDDDEDFYWNLDTKWKNKISSVQPWGNCQIQLHPQPNLGGGVEGPYKENTIDVGASADNKAQSVSFT